MNECTSLVILSNSHMIPIDIGLAQDVLVMRMVSKHLMNVIRKFSMFLKFYWKIYLLDGNFKLKVWTLHGNRYNVEHFVIPLLSYRAVPISYNCI